MKLYKLAFFAGIIVLFLQQAGSAHDNPTLTLVSSDSARNAASITYGREGCLQQCETIALVCSDNILYLELTMPASGRIGMLKMAADGSLSFKGSHKWHANFRFFSANKFDDREFSTWQTRWRLVDIKPSEFLNSHLNTEMLEMRVPGVPLFMPNVTLSGAGNERQHVSEFVAHCHALLEES